MAKATDKQDYKIGFYLKRKNTERTAIFALFFHDGVKTKIYTGLDVAVKQWNPEDQKCKTKGYDNSGLINAELERIEKVVGEYYLDCRRQGYIPSDEDLRRCVAPVQADTRSLSFFEAWDMYFEKKAITKAMRQKLAAIKTQLQGFDKKQRLILDRITASTMEDMHQYMSEVSQMQSSTVAKNLSFIKTFLHWCVKRELTENTKWVKFMVPGVPDTLKVALSKEELAQIKGADLKGKNYLDNVRSLFLISCYTGLRFSDYSRIGAEHIKKDTEGYVLTIRMEKTSDFVTIPLTDEGYKLCRGLIDGQIKIISNQKMNEYLKELCQIAGIDEPFEKHEFRGKLKITKSVPKWQLVGTHTGRRTFATSLLLAGIPAQVVMQYTGHRDYKSFQKYVNVPKDSQNSVVRDALRLLA